jgi:uncharacterized protein (DUF1697 family)
MVSTTVRYVALLRGVNNVGKSTRVAMADLRALFEGLGFGDVRTVLNSGNVVFSAPRTRRGDVHKRIRESLADELGVTAPVILLSGREIAAAVRGNPLADVATNSSHLLVVVPRQSSDRQRLKPLLERRWAPEKLAIGERVAYLWCANGVADSLLWPAVERALDRAATARNIATMTKLANLVKASS